MYLLADLIPSSDLVYKDGEYIYMENMEEINLEEVGIRLKRVFLTREHRIRKIDIRLRYGGQDRFLFYIKDGIKDDDLAQDFSDAVMCSLALVYNVAMEDHPAAIVAPENVIRKGKIIKIEDVVGAGGIGNALYFRVTTGVGVPREVLDAVWRVVPVVMKNKSLMEGVHFYRESILQVYVVDDDVFEIMFNNSDIPASRAERVHIETAYQNAYKAIEAIIGEPPKDERKLRTKLLQAGINPDEKVGYELYGMTPGKEALIEKLKNMQQTRDKKVAHGKTSAPRIIGCCEIKDKQALARHILLTHIDQLILRGETHIN